MLILKALRPVRLGSFFMLLYNSQTGMTDGRPCAWPNNEVIIGGRDKIWIIRI